MKARRLSRLRRLGVTGAIREASHRLLTRLPVHRLPGGWAPPVYALSWWLTEACNLACDMCWVGRAPGPTMPAGEWLRLADAVRRWRPRITLTGGEPTLYPDLLDVVRGVKQRGLYLSLNTNGLRLSSLAADLVRLGVDDISVSLDGMPAIHDAIRARSGAWRRTTEGLAALLDARGARAWPVVRVTTVLSARNLGDIEPLHRELQRLGVDCHTLQHRWFVSPRALEAHAGAAPSRLGVSAENLRGFLWASPEPISGLEEVLTRLSGPLLSLSPALDAADAEHYYASPERALRASCASRWYRMTILPDGTATPCLGFTAGSVRQEPFGRIWNGIPMRRFRTEIATRGLLPGCLRCCGLFSDQPETSRTHQPAPVPGDR